jgi:hypothetical protein
MKRTARVGLLVLCGVALVACGSATTGGGSSGPSGTTTSALQQLERQRQQARDALERWADAVAAAGGDQGFAIVGDPTGQIGDWGILVGGNNKLALLAGKIESANPLSDETPPPGEVRWEDGAITTLPMISAAQALRDLQAGGVKDSCPTCEALQVTAAKLSTVGIETSRGRATVPAWEFSLDGTAVHITRVAVAGASSIQVMSPGWDPNDPPIGLSISWAFGHPDGRQVMVGFVGDSCGTEYTAEAVESTTAVVVIIVEHATGEGCRGVGVDRTTTVQLATPLGDRAVLEVQEGLPVPVTLGP